MISIRRAAITDEATVYHFVCALEEKTLDADRFRDVYRQNVMHTDCYYLLAEEEGQPVGFVSLHTQLLLHHGGRTGEVQELFVEEGVRGRGIGQRLLTEVEALGNTLGLIEIEVTTNRRRTNTHQFYQRAGYTYSHLKFTKPLP